jgi:hypothetical protein
LCVGASEYAARRGVDLDVNTTSFKRMILSAVALAAIAGSAGTASAASREYRGYSNNDHALFQRQEAARRQVQDQERKLRSERRIAKLEAERRQYIRDYGVKSAEYTWFLTKWEKRWNDAVERERKLMIEQRMAARRRYEQQRLDVNRYDYLGVTDDCITRDLQRGGVVFFPYAERGRGSRYGEDNRSRPVDRRRDVPRRRDDKVNVDWSFGVRVHN